MNSHQIEDVMQKELGNTLLKYESLKVNKDKEYRCPVCHRLLMRGQVVRVEIRCPKCRRLVTIYK